MLGGGTLMPVHWGTFSLGLHAWDAPGEELLELAPRYGAASSRRVLGAPFEPAHVEVRDRGGADLQRSVRPQPRARSEQMSRPVARGRADRAARLRCDPRRERRRRRSARATSTCARAGKLVVYGFHSMMPKTGGKPNWPQARDRLRCARRGSTRST